MSVATEIGALLAEIEAALDAADFVRLADLDVVSPAGSLSEVVEIAELHHLLARTDDLRRRVDEAMNEVHAELRSLDSRRTAGRAYIAVQATAPPPSH